MISVRADNARRIVVASLTGDTTRQKVVEMVTAARGLAATHGWNILYDLTAASPRGISPAEIFWLPRELDVLREPQASRARIATLHREEHAEAARFWETTFRNAGLQARAFTEEGEAVSWLAPGADPGVH